MTPHKPPPESVAALRQRAEDQWRKKTEKSVDVFGDLTLRDTDLLLHELKVHQIELELQNEELRRAKTEADEVKARYQDLYDLAPVGYCTVNAAGLISQANQTLTALLGVTHKALFGKPLSRYVCREDQDNYYRFCQRVLSPPAKPGTVGEPSTCELRMPLADGTPFWTQWTASSELDAQGATELRLMVYDIRVRKAAEASLLLSASVFKHAREGIMITAPDGTIMDVNETFTHITGYARDEVLGQSPRMLSSGRHGPDFYAAM
jgi:PAS domain S-box-containing protein